MRLCFLRSSNFAQPPQGTAQRLACRGGSAVRVRQCHRHVLRISASRNDPQRPRPPQQTGPFGLRLQTNGDVLKFGLAAVALGFAVKQSIQLLGVPDLVAGQVTTGVLSVASLLAWISTYVFRVGTKTMTYAQQLKEYEDAVIAKRYEELSEEELNALREELEDEL